MNFSSKRAADRFDKMHPKMQEIAHDLDNFFSQNHYDLVITETFTTKEEDDALERLSSTHREGRAKDIRTRDLPPSFIKEVIARLETIYGEIGAISPSTGLPKIVVDKSKTKQPHLHIQLNRCFAVIFME